MGNARNLADLLGTSTKSNQVISTSGAITTTGAFTSPGIDDNGDATTITLDANEDITAANGMYVSGDLTSLTIDKGGIDRSGNTTRIISARSGGNYADMSINIAGTDKSDGNSGMNRCLYIDYQGNTTIDQGNLVIGTSGKGIDFSATGDLGSSINETLTDYEKGNFTATLTGTSGSAGSVAGNTGTWTYIKIGNFIHINGSIAISNLGSYSGNIQITGLPVTAGSNHGYGLGIGLHNLDGRSAASANFKARVGAGSTTITISKPDTTSVAWSELGTGYLGIGGGYQDFG